MTERDFVYWLQGFMEISGAKELTPEQVQIINDHLKLVLNKVTANRNGSITSTDSPSITINPLWNKLTCSAITSPVDGPFPKKLKG